MKKMVSIFMVLVISFTMLFAFPTTAEAKDNYNNSVIDSNISYIKRYICNNGFINGNGNYAFQYYDNDEYFDYYGLFVVNPNNNKLDFEYQVYDIDTDDLFATIKMDILPASQNMLKLKADFWDYSDDYSDILAYSYIDREFNHYNKKSVFYVEENYSSYSDYEAINLCSALSVIAFADWEYMLESEFGINLGAIGLHSYCSDHIYSTDSNCCIICGLCKPSSKLKGTVFSKVTPGNKLLKLTWKKVSNVTGYQIQFSTDKKFKKGNKTLTVKGASKSSTTIKNLKSQKTYYVRIRTIKNKKYSDWSKAKVVKIR